jgi:hypothetical protein
MDTQYRKAEPLTIAYVAIGADHVWGLSANVNEMSEKYGGQLHFIAAVIEHAWILDRMADGRELSVVFAYEIAEEFGKRFSLALFNREDEKAATPYALAARIAAKIFDEVEEDN